MIGKIPLYLEQFKMLYDIDEHTSGVSDKDMLRVSKIITIPIFSETIPEKLKVKMSFNEDNRHDQDRTKYSIPSQILKDLARKNKTIMDINDIYLYSNSNTANSAIMNGFSGGGGNDSLFSRGTGIVEYYDAANTLAGYLEDYDYELEDGKYIRFIEINTSTMSYGDYIVELMVASGTDTFVLKPEYHLLFKDLLFLDWKLFLYSKLKKLDGKSYGGGTIQTYVDRFSDAESKREELIKLMRTAGVILNPLITT